MKTKLLTCALCLCGISAVTGAQTENAQTLADNYSTCLKAAVIAEKSRETPSVEHVKQTCAEAIAAFHQSLPDDARVWVVNQLDQKLLQELQQ